MKYLRFSATLILPVLLTAGTRLAAQGNTPPASAPPALAAAQPAAATTGPVILFDNSTFDFAKSPVGEKVRHTYAVTNMGNEALLITNVHPGCHCTTVGDWTHRIEPGQTGGITVQFDTSGMSGPITRTIDVFSNAKNEPRKVLMLKGTVWKPIEVTPATAVVSIPPDSNEEKTTTVRIVNQTDNPVTISNPTSSNPAKFSAVLNEVKAGKEYELVVKVLPPYTPGNATGTISVNTTLPSMPVINETIIANVTPAVQVYPAQIPLSQAQDRWMTNRITIHGNTTNALTLSNPKASDPRIHVDLQSMGPKGMFSMIVAFPPGFALEPGQRAEVSVESSHPSFPVIRVPIIQYPQRGMPGRPFPNPGAAAMMRTNATATNATSARVNTALPVGQQH